LSVYERRQEAEIGVAKRVVLAYSGGLDTSVAVRWMIEEMGVEVITLAADVGQGGDFETIKQRALAAGAVEALGDEGIQGRLQRREPQAVVDELGVSGLEPGLLVGQVALQGEVFQVGGAKVARRLANLAGL
jgi:hypothetical protein